ncbi:tRNA lysidine(34) synthetase TilS [Rhizobiaceae bacterium n13]|uniref:tRNA(Ile)-lysidine synthase n=1 Tax=Ferirhizobium litorale TaxID=2927786 RepID=A0AAE3Q9F2_9HYPH|nr:tRNA lysidine(34) synthetase TilS [Fererhizobium litorale]MDI7860592.1 tRNA lysidine(34) synthetase TilS [Fererhizobium litorale]MDI7920740.1 tRNA lysidine(34) synthetase TilS [Fererhizobium litorale]
MNSTISPIDAAHRFLASLKQPARLVIAVSGGSDSTGLLLALKQAAPFNPHIALLAATIDHRLRRESADESRKVAALCAELGIPHYARAWEGDKPETGISAASRDARYRLLLEIADEVRADAIATAHTLDDQQETIAMRAIRSRSMESPGLAGMAPAVLLDRRVWLFRPLISCRRADIRAYLHAQGQGWIDDPSNDNPAYERVRTRLALAVGQEARHLADWQAVAERRRSLSNAAGELLKRHATVHHAVLAALSPDALDAEREVLRHALSTIIAVLGGRPHVPGSDRMDRVMDFLASGEPGRMTAGRVLVDRRRTGLYLLRESRDILPLRLESGGRGIFDGRFAVFLDPGAGPGIVASGSVRKSEVPPGYGDVPSAIARSANRLLPQITDLESGADLAGAATIVPALAPYDRFLPIFDLALADCIAALFGRQPFVPLPLQLH